MFTGAIFGGLAVILGAFGAHALKALLSPELLSSFETGVRYQMFHALLLLILPSLGYNQHQLKRLWLLISTGIVLFSGSIYALSLGSVLEWNVRWLGPVTPLGGTLLIAGWITLAYFAFTRNSIKSD